MQSLTQSIEALLFCTAEPQRFSVLAERLNVSQEEIEAAIEELSKSYESHAFTLLVFDGSVSLVTKPEHSALIKSIRKEELSKELTKASAETLAIVSYWPGISKAEIEFIRGVNASYTLRSLMIRGLIESKGVGRAILYHPTMQCLEHFGITQIEQLPQYEDVRQKLEALMKQN